MNVWELIAANKFTEACLEVDRLFQTTGSMSQMRNKVIALLKLGLFSEAETLCLKIREMHNFDTDSDSIFLGVSQWLQNKREAALGAWRKALGAKYTDAAGGVEARMLLLFGARVQELPDLEKMALRSLRKFSVRAPWPGPLASFAVGRIEEHDVRERISTIHALYCKYSCQADFYFGVLSRDPSKRIEHLWRAGYDYVPECYGMAEHHLAVFEYNASK